MFQEKLTLEFQNEEYEFQTVETIENIYYQAKNHIKVNFNYYNNTKINITDTIAIPIAEDILVFEAAY